MYIIKCQRTERPELHYFSGMLDTGEPLFSNFLSQASRYPSADAAQEFIRTLLHQRYIVRYIIEPEE